MSKKLVVLVLYPQCAFVLEESSVPLMNLDRKYRLEGQPEDVAGQDCVKKS